MNIETPFGIIKGRDAIHLEKMTSFLLPFRLMLVVSVARELCSNKLNLANQFTAAQIIFENVVMVNIHENEFLPIKKIPSSFVELKKSKTLIDNFEDGNEGHHYILHTYDYIFEVICKRYVFSLEIEF